ncbi:E3 ubiquitin ligase [Thoreauomyces humboldtii]|nr:E3 ubiquitin ligase [Thoreauomyces humboldtii]
MGKRKFNPFMDLADSARTSPDKRRRSRSRSRSHDDEATLNDPSSSHSDSEDTPSESSAFPTSLSIPSRPIDRNPCSSKAYTRSLRSLLVARTTRLQSLHDHLTCPICSDTYVVPYGLACDHAFCFRCIRTWFASLVERNQPMKCPVCRANCTVRPRSEVLLGRMVDDWVAAMDEEERRRVMQLIETGRTEVRELDRLPFEREFPAGDDRLMPDQEDGVSRCSRCNWEVVTGRCSNPLCGHVFADHGSGTDSEMDREAVDFYSEEEERMMRGNDRYGEDSDDSFVVHEGDDDLHQQMREEFAALGRAIRAPRRRSDSLGQSSDVSNDRAALDAAYEDIEDMERAMNFASSDDEEQRNDDEYAPRERIPLETDSEDDVPRHAFVSDEASEDSKEEGTESDDAHSAPRVAKTAAKRRTRRVVISDDDDDDDDDEATGSEDDNDSSPHRPAAASRRSRNSTVEDDEEVGWETEDEDVATPTMSRAAGRRDFDQHNVSDDSERERGYGNGARHGRINPGASDVDDDSATDEGFQHDDSAASYDEENSVDSDEGFQQDAPERSSYDDEDTFDSD